MNHFQGLINSYGPQIQVLLFISFFIVSWNIENITSLLISYKKWRHAFLNAPFILTNIPGQFLLGLAFTKTILWTSIHHFGILYCLPGRIHPIVFFLLAFLLFDLGEYIYHICMHKLKRLWMFHIVHHSDPVVDVSTTLREHPGENIVRLSFTLLWAFLTGASFWVLMLRQIVQVFTTLFAHMNYQLPKTTDKIIGLIFITPNLHQVHHHYKQPYTDSNYGDVLSIWDRLFGTFKRLPSDEIIFGVDTYMKKEENSTFISLLKLPLGKYRKPDPADEESN